ncbi:MAG: hypothetical protein GW762_02505 [Candidatus Pacebacteria bacterium]|nr:hypothetical protein [Candidatus Paceibacterota bacterium]
MPKQQPKNRSILSFQLLYLGFIFAIITLIVAVLFYQQNSLESVVKEDQKRHLYLVRDLVRSQIKSDIKHTTLFLENQTVKKFFTQQNPENKKDIQDYFGSITEQIHHFESIRIIDLQGEELIRVDSKEGNFHIVPDEQLQNKKNRYYFTDTISLQKNQVYISRFDLNIEHSYVELPQRPTVRYSSPIFIDEQLVGILIVNIDGNSLLTTISQTEGNTTQMYLANDQGYWLKFKDHSAEWVFMFEGDMTKKSIASTLPELWSNISQSQTYASFSDNNGVYASLPLYNTQIAGTKNAEELFLISYVSDETYTNYISYIKTLIILILIFLSIGLSFLFLSFIRVYSDNLMLKRMSDHSQELHQQHLSVLFTSLNRVLNDTKKIVQQLHENGLVNTWTKKIQEETNYGLQLINHTINITLKQGVLDSDASHELSLRSFLRDILASYSPHFTIKGDALIASNDQIEASFVHIISYIYVFTDAHDVSVSINQTEKGIDMLISGIIKPLNNSNQEQQETAPVPQELEFAHHTLSTYGGEILVSQTKTHISIRINISGL